MRLVERGERPGLTSQPGLVALRPGFLGGGKAAAVAQEKFGEAVAGAEEIGADVFATPQQIARGFFLVGRNVNGGQRAGPIEDGQLARVATIGLNAVAGASGNERWRDDLAGNVVGAERAL